MLSMGLSISCTLKLVAEGAYVRDIAAACKLTYATVEIWS